MKLVIDFDEVYKAYIENERETEERRLDDDGLRYAFGSAVLSAIRQLAFYRNDNSEISITDSVISYVINDQCLKESNKISNATESKKGE